MKKDKRNANSRPVESLIQRDARVVWHPFSHAATEPELVSVASAKGAWLQLENGTKILDGISLERQGLISFLRATGNRVQHWIEILVA